jgi:hypothetical protein
MFCKVRGYGGVAWHTIEDEWEPEEYVDILVDEDGHEYAVVGETTNPNEGMVCAMMVGDDQIFYFDPADVTEINLEEDDFCIECGQIGCGHLSAKEYLGED